MEKKLITALIIGLVVQTTISFPYPDKSSSSESSEDDSQQQQQQNIDVEVLEEFTKQIKTKGVKKVEKLQDDDPCLLPKRVGRCKAAVPRIFFNKAEGKCQTFFYGGCDSNQNNFRSLADCETTCKKHLPIVSILPHPADDDDTGKDQEDICTLAPVNEGSSCEALLPRWTYNATEGKCTQFIYGGCGATKNNFHTKHLCQSTCGNKQGDLTGTSTTESSRTSGRRLSGPEICSLPMEVGHCYALKPKYHFNKDNNRCEKFYYGGCGGNDNRFTTAQECIRTCGGDSASENAECANADCPWNLYTHYTTLGCKPIYDGLACCPTRFDCPDKEQNNTIEGRSLTLEENPGQISYEGKCQYRGKYYAIGDSVDEASDTGNCRASCICQDGHGPNPQPKITCANIECPEQLGAIPPEKVDCLPIYKKGSCCAYDFFCPNDTLRIIDSQQVQKEEINADPFKCTVDGEGFYEGQRFYPKKSKCLKCVCKKGFNGTLSDEFCETIDCGIEIYYSHYLARNCAPVYFMSADGTQSCCPISWECPNDEEITTPTTESPPSSSENPPPAPPPEEDLSVGPVPVTPRIPATAPPLVVPTATTVEIFIPPTKNVRNKTADLLLTQEVCDLPKVIGNCKGNRRRAFYNKETNACEEFAYSGCGGNDNNFVSLRDCQRLCITSTATTESSADGGNRALLRTYGANRTPQQAPRAIYTTEEDPCTLPKRVGNCKGYFQRFYYNPVENSCQPFIFGGCRGNRNNFYSLESCEATCTNSIAVENLRTSVHKGGDSSMVNFGEQVSPSSGGGRKSTQDLSADPCTQPKRTGRCRAFLTSFYYDAAEKQCKEFVYGGCGGNANNFKSILECEQRCPSTAEGNSGALSTEVQPGSNRRGGIGNGLDVISPQDSTSVSNAVGFLEKCRLPMKSGTCLALITSYYYNVETDSCSFFLYSGCFGNANRFSSINACETECKPSSNNEGIGGRTGNITPHRLPWRPTVTNNDDNSVAGRTANENITVNSSEVQNDTCTLPAELGLCKKHILRYYWDPKIKECLPFIYSGCRGNRNNFATETDCLSACGERPTIEQLTNDGILSCVFGNETLPLGATVVRGKLIEKEDPDSTEDMPCDVPVCQCVTPPSVTCVQRSCPLPPTTTTEKPPCPLIPECGESCKAVVGIDGCSSCDCDDENESQQVQVQEVEEFIKNVKG